MEDCKRLAAYTERFYVGRYVRDLKLEGSELVVHFDNRECFTVPCSEYPDLCHAVGEQDIDTLVRSINSAFQGDFTTYVIECGAMYHRTSA